MDLSQVQKAALAADCACYWSHRYKDRSDHSQDIDQDIDVDVKDTVRSPCTLLQMNSAATLLASASAMDVANQVILRQSAQSMHKLQLMQVMLHDQLSVQTLSIHMLNGFVPQHTHDLMSSLFSISVAECRNLCG